MKGREDIHVAVVEKYTLGGAITFTLVKHKHEAHVRQWRHHDYKVRVKMNITLNKCFQNIFNEAMKNVLTKCVTSR